MHGFQTPGTRPRHIAEGICGRCQTPVDGVPAWLTCQTPAGCLTLACRRCRRHCVSYGVRHPPRPALIGRVSHRVSDTWCTVSHRESDIGCTGIKHRVHGYQTPRTRPRHVDRRKRPWQAVAEWPRTPRGAACAAGAALSSSPPTASPNMQEPCSPQRRCEFVRCESGRAGVSGAAPRGRARARGAPGRRREAKALPPARPDASRTPQLCNPPPSSKVTFNP